MVGDGGESGVIVLGLLELSLDGCAQKVKNQPSDAEHAQ